MKKFFATIALIIMVTIPVTASAAAPASTTSSASKCISASEQLLAAIQEDASKAPGTYYVSEETMDQIREYIKETPKEGTFAFDWSSYRMGDASWKLSSEWYLFLDSKDRSFYLLREDASLIKLSCGYNSNADWNGCGNTMSLWGESTIVSNKNGFSIWELGQETKYILSDFVPEFDGWNSAGHRVFMHDGSDFRILDLEKEEVIEVCKDYAKEYEIFCNSFFYVNKKGHMATVNLLTLEEEEISEQQVQGFTGSDSIRGIDLEGNEIPLPGYVDWDGEFQAW